MLSALYDGLEAQVVDDNPIVLLCDAPVRAVQVSEMRGHRYVEKKEFRCDDIAARLNSIIKAVTPDELAMLGLPADYEAEFLRRKKHLFEVNRNFED